MMMLLLYSGGSDIRRCDISFDATTVESRDVPIEMIYRGFVIKRLPRSDTFSTLYLHVVRYSYSPCLNVCIIKCYKFHTLKLCRVSDDCSW